MKAFVHNIGGGSTQLTSYAVQAMVWTKYAVNEKSRHFFTRSTTTLSVYALQDKKRKMECRQHNRVHHDSALTQQTPSPLALE